MFEGFDLVHYLILVAGFVISGKISFNKGYKNGFKNAVSELEYQERAHSMRMDIVKAIAEAQEKAKQASK